MIRRSARFLQDQRGATAVEYGLIVSLIVIAMVVSLKQVADATTTMWVDVAEEVSSTR